MHQAGYFAVLVVLLPAVLGYGSGPPTSTNPTLCETMLPGHGTSTAKGPAPYAISLSVDEYKKAGAIDVTLHATESGKFFRGFFLQARRKDGLTPMAIGSFISEPEDETQFIKCGTFNSAWGHAQRNKKTSVTARWMGPSTDIGPLVFRATVVGYDQTEYWTDVESPDVMFGSAIGVRSHSLVLSLMAVAAYAVRM